MIANGKTKVCVDYDKILEMAEESNVTKANVSRAIGHSVSWFSQARKKEAAIPLECVKSLGEFLGVDCRKFIKKESLGVAEGYLTSMEHKDSKENNVFLKDITIKSVESVVELWGKKEKLNSDEAMSQIEAILKFADVLEKEIKAKR